MSSRSPSGLQAVPSLEWGSHLIQFFGSGSEVRDLAVPYFKAGLENNERCFWVTGAAFTADEARQALRAAVPDLDRRERAGQIEIANAADWYAPGAKLKARELVRGLLQRADEALASGYAGLRTHGDGAWVSPEQWPDFLEYESMVHTETAGRRTICVCGYSHDQLSGGAYADLMARHDMAVSAPVLRRVASSVSESQEQELRALERRQQTFDRAMIAAQMGTWRYTIADNICIYDDNAQRLYGLTEARMLHDEAGARRKIHADDLDRMWTRVNQALDPAGDGRYDVEYRVKQLDGSWRWVSAWGLVEFEGEGAARKPVAIAGASRDLSDRKEAERLQHLLNNELQHRVKNTMATLQAIAGQTLATARDLPSAQDALDRRILSMAEAHDLLTASTWSGANLKDVVTRTLKAFAATRIDIAGDDLDIPPRHTLALSIALHELATNAIKYGALSQTGGRVAVRWTVRDQMLCLDWSESGGPEVTAPTRSGFGTQLIEGLAQDLGGKAVLAYDAAGVRCWITVPLGARP